ncbi:MAG: KH domain-containing protein [Candidatus Pacebacteria bacterium]|nr:KH domain-containing protein [Candidatus Paceibacterota bacterium]
MIGQDNIEIIKKEVREFFEKMNFLVEIESPSQKENTVFVNLKTEEPKILIGEGGQTLMEIQHLLRVILRKKISEPFFLDLDISDYKKKKIEYLKELARNTADEVSLTKKEKILQPMPAYERRIVHLELSERTDVLTESEGEGPDRKIIIKPRA